VSRLAGLALCLLPLLGIAGERTELSVYGSIEPDELREWVAAFERDHPDIRLVVTRGSTGVLTARILAEGSAPRADVIWRLANTSLIRFAERGLLQPVRIDGADRIAPEFRARQDPPPWIGHVGYMGVVCFNVKEAERLALPAPRSWKDLLAPRFKGRIVMPSPAASGTGFLHLASWLQAFGEEAGWEYFRALNENVMLYTTSGSKPCTLAASGEVAVGLSFSTRAAALKESGAPIDLVFPREGVGWDLEGSAIFATTRKPEASRRFLEWAIGRSAMEVYRRRYPLLGMAELAPALPHHPREPRSAVVPLDFYALSAQRDRIIAEWERQYAHKTEK
jgi:iron(III) transport system substrate-binding protein